MTELYRQQMYKEFLVCTGSLIQSGPILESKACVQFFRKRAKKGKKMFKKGKKGGKF